MSNEAHTSDQITRWKCVGYCRHCTADEDDSTFSKEWGHFEKSDNGVWVRADSALAEIERLRAALKELASYNTVLGPQAIRRLVRKALAGEPACQYCARGLDLLEKGHLHHDGDGYVRCEK